MGLLRAPKLTWEPWQGPLDRTALQADEDVNVRIHRVTSKLVDTFKDRYTEYTVTVSHKVGYDKPYKLRIKVPVPNDSGYFKIGGNDYVLLS